jgi:DNA uptake protein ComE-like DNA-binding protein
MRRVSRVTLVLAAVLAWGLAITPSRALAAGAKDKIDINSASQAELESLPGVGAATAKKIIAGRPFSSVGDLSRAGVSAATIDKLKPLVKAGRSSTAAAEPAKEAKAAAAPMEQKAAKTAKETRSEMKAEAAAPAGGRLDLNTASEKELEALPAVGAATAKKIIAGRPYSSVGDLSKAGLSAKTIQTIGPLVTVGAKASAPMASAPAASQAAPASSGKTAATSKPSSSEKAATGPAGPPPVKGMVWVNTETKVFHREGDKWYGNTKHGKYMNEADAVKAGYRESKEHMKKS